MRNVIVFDAGERDPKVMALVLRAAFSVRSKVGGAIYGIVTDHASPAKVPRNSLVEVVKLPANFRALETWISSLSPRSVYVLSCGKLRDIIVRAVRGKNCWVLPKVSSRRFVSFLEKISRGDLSPFVKV